MITRYAIKKMSLERFSPELAFKSGEVRDNCNHCRMEMGDFRERRTNSCKDCNISSGIRAQWNKFHRVNGLPETDLSVSDVTFIRRHCLQCEKCGAIGKTEIDKIIPERGYFWVNLAALCRACNGQKRDHTLETLASWFQWLLDRNEGLVHPMAQGYV